MPTPTIETVNRANNRQFVNRGQLLGAIGANDVLTGVAATAINNGTWRAPDSRSPLAVTVSLTGVTGAAFVARVLVCNDQIKPADTDNNHPQLGSDITVATGPKAVESDRGWHWVKTIIAVAGSAGTVTSGFCAG